MLELRGVSAGYDQTPVLRDVDLAVPDGTVVALFGPNGAGKTTLLRTAAGILRAEAGRVVLDGMDVTGEQVHQRTRRGICHIPEGRGVFPSLTVAENLTLFSRRDRRKESIEKAADTFPSLGKRLRQVAGSLSGGEQQMLAIVRAYLTEPSVVLVDEASMGLAPLMVDRIFEFMTRIAREGVALLIVEQYVSRAMELAQQVYLLNHGRIAFSGSASDLGQAEIFERYLGVG